MERNNEELNYKIEKFINTWYGTSIGNDVKNMYENGSDYETILEKMETV